MSKQLKVVALTTNASDNPAAWWRITRPYVHLKRYGIDANWCWLDSNGKPELDVRDAIVVLQRVICPSGEAESFVKKLKDLGASHVVYELDDDIVTHNYLSYMQACGRTTVSVLAGLQDELFRHREIINACDAVTVTGPALQQTVYSVYNKGEVYIVPNVIDVYWFEDRLDSEHPYQKQLGITYIGYGGGLRPSYDVEEMAIAWGAIARKTTEEEIMFVVAGFQHDAIYRYVDLERIIRLPSTDLEHWPALMQVDIGCVPLKENRFNYCKSPIKAMEYAIAGAQVIASPVIHNMLGNVHDIMSGKAYTAKEWEQELNKALQDGTHPVETGEYFTAFHGLERGWEVWKNTYEAILNS